MFKHYSLTAFLDKKSRLSLHIEANDNNHAQAQCSDIVRALDIKKYTIEYGEGKHSHLSELFNKLSSSNFSHKDCYLWGGALSNGYACIYLNKKRIYIRKLILSYFNLDENIEIKTTCKNKNCVNPYHFEYVQNKNTKLSCGDLRLLLAYRSQGTGVNQIAEALNVHRSTIYRKLKNERLSSGSANHGRS